MSGFTRRWWLVPAAIVSLGSMAEIGWTQSITSTPNDAGTRVTQQGNQYNIEGGTLSGDRQTLFHSFERLGLNSNEIANFLANPQIDNILGRVTGGDASILDGLIRVSNSDAHLYLMNPAGIVFGPNARLDLAGAFTATTATGIGFGNSWFNAIGTNDYNTLVGNPSSFAFNLSQPGTIANLGNLSVAEGQNLALVGGTIVNTGTLEAPGGTVTIAAVPGENLVRLSQAGSLLSVEFEPLPVDGSNPGALTPASLPQLLTGGNLNDATALTVNADGTVSLGGAATAIATTPGSATIAGTVTTAAPTTAVNSEIVVVGDRLSLLGATLDASGLVGSSTIRIDGENLNLNDVEIEAGNVILQAGTLNVNDARMRSRQDLLLQSRNDLTIRDTVEGDSLLLAGRRLRLTGQTGVLEIQDAANGAIIVDVGGAIDLRGGNGITINALTDSASIFRSNSNITLVSGGPTVTDGRFWARGNFAALDTLGNPSNIGPGRDASSVISASGNVTFGNYTGVSLWVEALGSIRGGNITITGANTTLTGSAPEVAVLSTVPSVILRAGIAQLRNSANLTTPQLLEGTTFTPAPLSGGNLRVGDISTDLINTDSELLDNGQVILSARGFIRTGNVFTGARIEMNAGGPITTQRLATNYLYSASGPGLAVDFGNIRLVSGSDITVSTLASGAGGIDVTAAGSFRAIGYGTPTLGPDIIPLRGNTALLNYLESQGVPANLLANAADFIVYLDSEEPFVRTRTDNARLPVSILGSPDGEVFTSSYYIAPITIRYGGGGSTLVDEQFPVEERLGRITISGSGESFTTGPTIAANTPLIVPANPEDTFANFDPSSPFDLRSNNVYGLLPANTLRNASGTRGAIFVGLGSNTSLYGSLQNNTFAPLPPNPSVNPDEGGTPIGDTPGAKPGEILDDGNNLNSVALQNMVDQSQQDTNLADGNTCNTASTATGSEAIALRDADIAGATCVTPVVETSILQIDPSLLQPAAPPQEP